MQKQISIPKRYRRLVVLVLVMLLISVGFYLKFRKKDYQMEYTRQNYLITEAYHKEDNYYSFILKNDESTFYTMVTDQHFSSKKIINHIEEYTLDDYKCIIPMSNKVRFDPLCYYNNEQISYRLVSKEMKEILPVEFTSQNEQLLTSYQNIDIYNYFQSEYYIWNYRGFIHLQENKEEVISLFSKDIYHPNLITQVDHILFIPDYESDYYFRKAYLLDMKSGKTSTWELEENIYYDSYILGVIDSELYLVDRHEKCEWQINVHKKTMKKIGKENKNGLIYQNGFQEISMTKLLYQEIFFEGIYPYTYQINNGLYLLSNQYKIKLSQEIPKSIIGFYKDKVYYLIDDKLYGYDNYVGEVLLMHCFEWNFNYDNAIFVLNEF